MFKLEPLTPLSLYLLLIAFILAFIIQSYEYVDTRNSCTYINIIT